MAQTGVVIERRLCVLGASPHSHGLVDARRFEIMIPSPIDPQCRAVGCAVLDGPGMWVNQGAIAIRLWTGVDVGRSVRRRELEWVLDLS